MIRNTVIGLTALGLLLAVPAEPRAESNNFLDQFRYNPEFDKPKYQRYQRPAERRIGNFGSTNNTFSGSGDSGLYFERRRITQPGDIGLKRDDQNTQINLRIRF